MNYNLAFIYFRKTPNNFFLIVNYNKIIKIFNVGNLSLKNKPKTFSIIFEAMFSKIVELLKKCNISSILLQSNTKQFFSKTIVTLLFKNFFKYNLKIVKFNFKIQLAHNGCRLKK
jgi:hypothetical protein